MSFLVGKKVVLRALRPSDVNLFVRWLNNPNTREYLLRRFPLTAQAEREWVEEMSKKERLPTGLVFVIETRDQNRTIGTMGLHEVDWINRTAVTGTVIGEEAARRQGHAREAKLLLLKYAFDTLGLRKITSRVFAKNDASLGYAGKCGYVREAVLKKQILRDGEFEDIVILACFRETWLPRWEEYQGGK